MRTRSTPHLLRLLLIGGLLAVPEVAEAQRGFGRGRDPGALWGIPPVRTGFYFCRLMYDAVRNDASGTGWRVDYPGADQNFMIRLAQLTKTPISEWRDGPPGSYEGFWPDYPGHTVVQATDPELFQCPFLMMASPGTVGFSAAEVEKLREYLLKGGFLWGDDFWGNASWYHWIDQIGRVLPDHEIVELTPDHALFSTFYSIHEFPQIPSLNAYRRMGYASTSEMGAESARPSIHAIFDHEGRPMIIMTHNTDIADGWEREADLEVFFQRFAWQAYAVGVNVMMWIMTR